MRNNMVTVFSRFRDGKAKMRNIIRGSRGNLVMIGRALCRVRLAIITPLFQRAFARETGIFQRMTLQTTLRPVIDAVSGKSGVRSRAQPLTKILLIIVTGSMNSARPVSKPPLPSSFSLFLSFPSFPN